ncbi:hypothetical protein EYF80_010025 [Liparis tanakae]|uniref:Uncharacterized protein n=1 Tax=Liparis tanakae TaxID=230148 RepID=A0A4Z2IP93_9TELE|nr:hypothetical protein EYF80_010025 [Liparis tanakae]
MLETWRKRTQQAKLNNHTSCAHRTASPEPPPPHSAGHFEARMYVGSGALTPSCKSSPSVCERPEDRSQAKQWDSEEEDVEREEYQGTGDQALVYVTKGPETVVLLLKSTPTGPQRDSCAEHGYSRNMAVQHGARRERHEGKPFGNMYYMTGRRHSAGPSSSTKETKRLQGHFPSLPPCGDQRKGVQDLQTTPSVAAETQLGRKGPQAK